ncbi:MAG: family peptidase [Solirubrobacteraceae bacterium]|nr:family peptidase [Solirubrobacteraceae bacterium]
MLVALLAGITLGGHPQMLPSFVRNIFVGDKDTQVVREAIDKVNSEYYRQIPEKDLANAAIAGIVKSLGDRFSNYFSPAEYKQFREATDNAYEGIGVAVVPVKRGLRVSTVYDGSPAKRSGITEGDVITAVGAHSLAGKAAAQGSTMIKGPPGTSVTLSVLHGGHVRTLLVVRAQITVPFVA